MNDAPTLLLDTNVWIDLYDGNRANHVDAQTLLERALMCGAPVTFAISSLKDVYHALSAMMKRCIRSERGHVTEAESKAAEESAWACIKNMQELATPVGVDLSDVWLAGSYRTLHRDFEDNLIAAAATRCQADVLVTNDGRFLRHCPVRAMDAADALSYLKLCTPGADVS